MTSRTPQAFADAVYKGAEAEHEALRIIEGMPALEAAALAMVVVTGRYPGRIECNVEAGRLESGDPQRWLRRIMSLPKSGNRVHFAEPGLYVDVTHTSEYQWISGIQRVVRDTAGELVRSHGARLFRCVPEAGPVLLSDKETASFIALDQTTLKEASTGSSTRTKTVARSLLPPVTMQAARWLKKRLQPLNASSEEVLWLEGCDIILLELLSTSRADIYFSLVRSARFSIAVFHDLIPISHPHYCHPDIVGNHVEYLNALGEFDRITTVSKCSAEALENYFIMSGMDVPVVPHLLPDFSDRKNNAKENRYDREEPLLLYVSTLDPRKNHWRLMEACEELWESGEKFRLRLVGGAGWRNSVVLRRIAQLQTRGFPLDYTTDFLTDDEVTSFLDSAYFTVFCSEVEGYGLPIAESLAAGIPVICSNVGSMREIADTVGGCVKIDPFKIGSIRDGIRRCLHDPEERDRLIGEVDIGRLGNVGGYAEFLKELVRKGRDSN